MLSGDAGSGLTSRSRAYHFGPARHADHFVYRCYDAVDTLLYIGVTSNVKRRIAAHRRGENDVGRWLVATMDRFEVEGPFRGRERGRDVERRAIQLEQPLFNYQDRADARIAAWMTRRPIALYLIDRGHLDLALATLCGCWPETKAVGGFDEWCAAHVAAYAVSERAS